MAKEAYLISVLALHLEQEPIQASVINIYNKWAIELMSNAISKPLKIGVLHENNMGIVKEMKSIWSGCCFDVFDNRRLSLHVFFIFSSITVYRLG